MNVCILGHLVLDELHLSDRRVVESYGGIYFAIGTFSGISSKDDIILPVLPVGDDIFDEAEKRFHQLPHVLMHGVYPLPHPTTRVKLFYDSLTSYSTCLVTELPPISFEKLQPYLTADLIYMNMMTANDIKINTAERMRHSTDAIIYFDTHMLSYSVAENGSRQLQSNPDWSRWCSIADVVQMNEREVRTFIEMNLDEKEAVRRILSNNRTRYIIVTRGESGASIYYLINHEVQRFDVEAVHVAAIADTTGCGDAFGSAFAYKYAQGCDVIDCGKFAAFVASRFATFHGSEGMGKLHQMMSAFSG